MAAPSRKPPTVLVLAIVAGLLLVFSGVMTTLFLIKSSELNDTRRTLTAQVAERDATIETQGSEIEKLKRDLDTAKGQIDDIQQDLEGTENQRAELERQKQVISKCFDLLGEAGSAASRGDRAAYEKTIKEAEKVCDEADRYL